MARPRTATFLLLVLTFLSASALAQSATVPAAPTIPPGTIIMFAGKTTPLPGGWLACEGQMVPVTQFPALYKAIGTIYGGDGVNEFRLPDLRGRVAIGAGTGAGLSPRPLAGLGGEELHSLSVSEMPVHSHIQTLDDNTGAQGGANQTDGNGGNEATGNNNGRTRTEGGNQPHNNMQPFIALNFLIKS